jgi:hypothetical protein
LVAQAEKGDLFTAEVQVVKVEELFVPIVLQLADIPMSRSYSFSISGHGRNVHDLDQEERRCAAKE